MHSLSKTSASSSIPSKSPLSVSIPSSSASSSSSPSSSPSCDCFSSFFFFLCICDSPYPFGASNLTYTTVEYSEECWDSLLGAFPTNVDSTSMLIPCVIDGSASACLARYALFKGYHAITFTGLMLGEYATVKRKYVESAWSRSAGNFLTDDTHSGDLQPTTVHIL